MIAAITRWWRQKKDSHVSDRWLRAYAQSQSRICFHGPRWNWNYLIAEARKKRRHGLRRVA